MKANKNLCGKRVKMARIDKEMTQIDLAAALSVDVGMEISQKALSRLEQGNRLVRDIELVALAEIPQCAAGPQCANVRPVKHTSRPICCAIPPAVQQCAPSSVCAHFLCDTRAPNPAPTLFLFRTRGFKMLMRSTSIIWMQAVAREFFMRPPVWQLVWSS